MVFINQRVERRFSIEIMDIKLQPRAATLVRAPAFAHLTAKTLQQLAATATELTLKPGGLVFARGAPATGLYVIATGHLVLSMQSPQGAEHVIELMQPGDSFGEAALLTGHAHLVTAAAVTACDLLRIDRQSLINAITHDREFALNVIATLSEQIYRQTGALENLLFLRASGRVARFIFARLKLDDTIAGHRVALPVRKGLIASHLNMTQEHFSRTLHELSTAGLIRVDGVMVDVIDIEKLRDAAGLLRISENAGQAS